MTDSIEQEIQTKGLTAPRITPADIEAEIVAEAYMTGEHFNEGGIHVQVSEGWWEHGHAADQLTICVLVLRNGFTVTGESACASPENFDEEIGRKIARQNALQKIWQLEGYLLRERLHNAAAVADAVALLEVSADCCDANAAARYDSRQADQDLTNAASYRLAASLLQA